MQADVNQREIRKLTDGMAAMTVRGVEAGPAAAVHAPWQRTNKLPPLDQQALVGQQAQLTQLQELIQADGRTVLTIWGSAGMVSLASLATTCCILSCIAACKRPMA